MAYGLIKFCQKHTFPVKNDFQSGRPMGEEAFDQWRRIHDVPYATEYPNSFLDIYLHQDSQAQPTLFYVHGGGFTWGSKVDGDPNAGKNRTDKDWYFKRFLAEGYNIVSIDYAFAPEYAYPTPIIQTCQAGQFLMEHGGEYGLDMSRVILAGSSAGGQIIGQFANIQTNSAYAEEMKLPQVFPEGTIKACLFNSGLLDCERYGEAHSVPFNYLFAKCGEAYFHCKESKGHPAAIQSSVIAHATPAFPPAFLSDANTASFFDQARDFAKRLEELGVEHELNIYPRSEAKLSHGYESFNNKYGQDNMRKMLIFLKKQGV